MISFRPILSFFVFLLLLNNPIKISGQKHTMMSASFTIKEIKTKPDRSTLIMGSVNFDNLDDIIKYDIKFPKKEKWVIIDSTLSKYVNDTLISTSKSLFLNEQMLFKSILEFKNQDFGLKEAGFTVSSVNEYKEGVVLEWAPPQQMEGFIKKVITQMENNLLLSLIFVDVDGKEFNKTFYEDYHYINNLPVPTKVSSHFIAQEEEIFKIISFRNVEIN